MVSKDVFKLFSAMAVITVVLEQSFLWRTTTVTSVAHDNRTTNEKGTQGIDPEQFHISNYEEIRRIVNESTIIGWAPKFTEFVAHFGLSTDESSGSQENRTKLWNNTRREMVYSASLCQAALDFYRTGQIKPHVLQSHFNENWGVFSTPVSNRTVNWGDLESHWRRQGCSTKFIFDYLNHPNTLGVISVQFQAYDHPKVHSIPLGVKGKSRFLAQLKKPWGNRTNLLMLNFNTASPYRADISDTVIGNFNGSISNTYGGRNTVESYIDEMLASKFILSPGGMGWDCYRHWEAIYLGAIPVLERYNRTDGWHRTFDDLPVLWVNNYKELTPGLLETEYKRIAARADEYNYEKLTSQWWVDFVKSLL